MTFLTAMDSIYTYLGIQKARNDRLFIETRFNQNKLDLAVAEEALKVYQEELGVVDIPEQTRVAIAYAAELQSMIHRTEIELAVKQQHLAADHREILQLKNKLRELNQKMDRLQYAQPTGESNGVGDDLFVPFDKVPDIGLEYVRLLREVEVQNQLYELLIQMYEQAKIEEARDMPSIQVLDYPSVPIYKAKPKRAIIVVIAALISLIITVVAVFIREFVISAMDRDDEQSKKMRWIRDQIAGDVPFSRKR